MKSRRLNNIKYCRNTGNKLSGHYWWWSYTHRHIPIFKNNIKMNIFKKWTYLNKNIFWERFQDVPDVTTFLNDLSRSDSPHICYKLLQWQYYIENFLIKLVINAKCYLKGPRWKTLEHINYNNNMQGIIFSEGLRE